MKLSRIVLFPFAVLYDAVTSVRNQLFDLKLKPSAEFDVPVISVGNLTVGGTGKTPMIEHLVRLLVPHFKVATLSRGYKRTTRGYRLAGATDSPSTLGDEPFQFYQKFKDKIAVAVGEERAMAIPQIVNDYEDVQVILLDDAFQHRYVKPQLQILLTDYHRLFYNDLLLPAGQLRESKRGAQRADVVVVTKCPTNIAEEEMMEIEKQVRQYSSKPIFFASIRYGEPVNENARSLPEKVVLVSGLADGGPFEKFATNTYNVVTHVRFADHHTYTPDDIRDLIEKARKENAAILTTEKDWVKLKTLDFGAISLFYVPIEVEFIKNGKDFDEIVLNAIADASK